MATDWAADVKKYVANADDAAIAGIVRYCGIALRNRDSSLVSFSDKTETDRVRNNYLKKKLGLTQSDAVLDKAIAKVGEVMKADRTKNRVTVYYLLADEFKKLGLFVKAPAASKAAATKAPAKAAAKPAAKKTAAKAVGAAAAVAGAAAATKVAAKKPAAKKATPKVSTVKAEAKPQSLVDKTAAVASDAGKVGTAAVAGTVAAGAAVAGAAIAATSSAASAATETVSAAADKGAALFTPGAQASSSDSEGGGMGWLLWLLAAALALFALWWLFGRGGADGDAVSATATEAAASVDASAPADLASAPAEGTVAIPAGAGVTSELRDGKPVVKVYFDSGKTLVAPAFGAAAGGLKAYLDGHPGSTLAVSGYADPTGNAARNEQLSKQRAQAVQAELIKSGIPEASAQLVKPASSTDATVSKEAARRVEVTVQ